VTEPKQAADVGTLVSCSYLAASLTYAHFTGGVHATAWEQVMLPTMIGEYVFAFAILMTLNAREHSGEAASGSTIVWKGILSGFPSSVSRLCCVSPVEGCADCCSRLRCRELGG
jgi:hypothetical protein